MVHSVKCERRYFHPVEQGLKNFEIRFNDRNYEVDDILILFEIDDSGKITGNKLEFLIVYILDDNRFLKEGFVALGLAPFVDV